MKLRIFLITLFLFIDLLKVQLEEIPQDFFVDIVAQQNYLVKTLQVRMSFFKIKTSLITRTR